MTAQRETPHYCRACGNTTRRWTASGWLCWVHLNTELTDHNKGQ